MKNVTTGGAQKSATLEQLYAEVLATRKELDSMVVNTDKIDALSGAVSKCLCIIENTALLASANNSILSAMMRRMDALIDHPVLGPVIKKEFAELLTLKFKIIDGRFGEVSVFCQKVEESERHKMLIARGIDPKDEARAFAFMHDMLTKVVCPDPNPQN